MHELVDVHSKHTKPTVWVKCKIVNVRVGGTYNDHFAVKGSINMKVPLLCISCLFNNALSTWMTEFI